FNVSTVSFCIATSDAGEARHQCPTYNRDRSASQTGFIDVGDERSRRSAGGPVDPATVSAVASVAAVMMRAAVASGILAALAPVVLTVAAVVARVARRTQQPVGDHERCAGTGRKNRPVPHSP